MEFSISTLMTGEVATVFHRLFSFSFCDAETQTKITGEFLDRLEFELKSTDEEKDKLAKEKDEWTRDSKRLQHALKNLKFDISKFKEKGEDIEF